MKRTLSCLLCILLAVSVCPLIGPTPAYASPSESEIYAEMLAMEGDYDYSELSVAEKRALIDNATLSPLTTGYAPLDDLVTAAFDEIFTPDMTVYEKVCACFLYLMDDSVYDDNDTTLALYSTIGNEIRYESRLDRNTVCEAYGMLKDKIGMCQHFASAFMVMTRAIGLESYVITCVNSTAFSGTGGHEAAMIRLNGRLFLFDPVMGVVKQNTEEVESSGYFCALLVSNPSREYCELEETVENFNYFRTDPNASSGVAEVITGQTPGETYVEFGSYPQSRVTDETLLAQLNAALDEESLVPMTTYAGTGEAGTAAPTAGMYYADIVCGGAKYRAVRIDQYRPIYTYREATADNSYQDEAGYTVGNTIYWFAFEPIEWRVTDENGLLVADLALDAGAYNDTVYPLAEGIAGADGVVRYAFADEEHTVPANEWASSSVRQFLNEDFYSVAFTDAERALIVESQNRNTGAYGAFNYAATTDNIFLLSRSEVNHDGYFLSASKSALKAKTTDYAMARGVAVTRKGVNESCSWLLRSAGLHSADVTAVSTGGKVVFHMSACAAMEGIRPALRITSVDALSPEVLSAPRRLTATPTGDGEITLRSSPCNGAERYVFSCYREGSDVPESVYSSESPQLVVTGLAIGVRYVFRVSCERGEGETLETSPETVSSPVLVRLFISAPSGLAGEAVSTGKIRVTWNPVDGAIGYKVYYFEDSITLLPCGSSATNSCLVTGLRTGRTYLFKVTSISADGSESGYSASTATCTCQSYPAQPTGLAGEATATGEVTLTWEPVADAGSYRVYRNSRTDGYQVIGTTQTASFTESGLNVGGTYAYRVTAVTADGQHESGRSDAYYFQPESVPAIPDGVTAVTTSTGELTLSWNAVDGAGSYRVYLYQNEKYSEIAETQNTSFTLGDLSVGRAYAFRVTALTPDGGSESVMSARCTETCGSIPPIPEALAAETAATGVLRLTWEPSEGAGKYRVFRYTTAGGYALLGETEDTSYLCGGLDYNGTYYFSVTALTADGTHESAIAPKVNAVCGSVPAVPTGLAGVASGTNQITLSWDPVENAGFYRVYHYSAADGTTLIGETDVPSFTETELTVGTRYVYRVTALTADGENESALSELHYATCESVPAKPAGLTSVATATGALTLSWNAVPDAGSYKVWRYTSADGYTLLGTTEIPSFAVSGLSAGSSYSFHVSALTADGGSESVKSARYTVSAESIPAKPEGLTSVAVATGALTLSWDAVPDAGSYKVFQYTAAAGYTLLGETDTPSFTVSGLTVGSTCYFCVSALTADGGSESVKSARYSVAAESVPAKPAGLTSVAVATGALTLSWDAVPDAGSYKVWRYTTADGYTLLGETDTTSFAVSGLTVGSSYSFHVSALTADGGSESVKSARYSVAAESVPAKPTGLTGATLAPDSVTLSWTAVPGAGSYKIFRYISGAYAEIGTSDTNSFTVTGLKTGGSNTFRVSAVTPDGASESSMSASKTVTCGTVPAAPQNPAVSTEDGMTARFTWDPVAEAAGYAVYVRTEPGTEYVLIGTTESCAFEYATEEENVEFAFRVTALAASDAGVVYGRPSADAVFVSAGPLTLIAGPADAFSDDPAVPLGFTVSARGFGLTYQWYKKAADADGYDAIAGATDETLTLAAEPSVHGTLVYCRVTDAYGASLDTDPARASVLLISAQPQNVGLTANNQTAVFRVSAVGDGLTYRWYYKNATATSFTASSSTSASCSCTMTSARNGRQFYCEITDDAGHTVTSDIARMSVLSITKQPAGVAVKRTGLTCTFSVEASGAGLTYAWYYKNPADEAFSKSTVTGATYSISMTDARNGRQVYCVVTDKYGNSLRTNTVAMSVLSITAQPQSVGVTANNQTATFSLTAAGTELSYAWYFRNAGSTSYKKSSATTNSYSVVMTAARNGRQVYCVVTDKWGNTATSDVAVMSRLAFTKQPVGVAVQKNGDTATFTAAASGEDVTYAWYYRDPGASNFSKSSATGTSFSSAMSDARNGREVYCVATDKYGCTRRSDTAVMSRITITRQPQNAALSALNQKAVFTVAAEGEGLSYRWYYKNAGAETFTASSGTGTSYSIVLTAARKGRAVYCEITDAYGNTVRTNAAVMSLLTFTQQPKGVAVQANGQTCTFTARASDEEATYAWYYRDPGAATFTKTSATGATYSISMTAARSGREIYCVATDRYGCTVTSDTAVMSRISITTQPVSAVVSANNKKATFTVAAQGDGLSYRWYYRNAGAESFTASTGTGASYTCTMTDARNGRAFFCRITDAYGNSVDTDTVVMSRISFTTQPADVTVSKVGQTAAFTAKASGEGVTYVWYYRNPGATAFSQSTVTSSSYSCSVTAARNGREVYCVATDAFGNTVKSAVAVMRVAS